MKLLGFLFFSCLYFGHGVETKAFSPTEKAMEPRLAESRCGSALACSPQPDDNFPHLVEGKTGLPLRLSGFSFYFSGFGASITLGAREFLIHTGLSPPLV